MRRAPSILRPESEGSYPLTFPRLVQPVLNTRCVPCHEREKAPSLQGDRFGAHGWSEAFLTLKPLAWGMSGGNGVALKERQYSIPGEAGARASKLYALLERGHYGTQLSAEEMRRITLWLDANSNFYGAYTAAAEQARGKAIQPRWGRPLGEAMER